MNEEKIRILLNKHKEEAREFVKTHFKDEAGKPIILADGQCDIFNLITKKLSSRNHIETHTRYGKSLTVALATLTRITTFPEKFSIVAGTDKQASIIMGYIIDHIYDHSYFRNKFVLGKGETEESIRRYKNKSKLNFVVYTKQELRKMGEKSPRDLMGEIFITNAKGAMGWGAPNIIHDEAALTKDDEEALVFRMLGDQIENFYFKIGNPWDSGHFRESYENPDYFKIKIDWKRGLKENRISIEQIEEARTKPFFGILFDCNFPPRGLPDDRGWTPLLTKEDIDRAIVNEEEITPFGINKLGGDIAGGGKNFSVLIQRHTNVAKILLKNNDPDTMNFAEAVINHRRNRLAGMDGIFLDNIGEGKGATDMVKRELRGIIPFNGAESPFAINDRDLFFNIRAMCYWRARQWILNGGKLIKGEEPLESTWYQLTKVKYFRSTERMRMKMKIMSKEDMAKEGIPSPDVADALMMTFLTEDIHLNYEEEKPQQKTPEEIRMERYGLFPKV